MIMRIPILKSILRNLDWFEEARRHHVAPDGSILLGGTNHRLKKAGDWEESKHPRADDGKFTSGSGGGSKKPSKTKRKLERRAEAASQGRVSGAIQTLLSGGSALDKIGWLNTSKPKEPEKKPEKAPEKAPEQKPESGDKPKTPLKPEQIRRAQWKVARILLSIFIDSWGDKKLSSYEASVLDFLSDQRDNPKPLTDNQKRFFRKLALEGAKSKPKLAANYLSETFLQQIGLGPVPNAIQEKPTESKPQQPEKKPEQQRLPKYEDIPGAERLVGGPGVIPFSTDKYGGWNGLYHSHDQKVIGKMENGLLRLDVYDAKSNKLLSSAKFDLKEDKNFGTNVKGKHGNVKINYLKVNKIPEGFPAYTDRAAIDRKLEVDEYVGNTRESIASTHPDMQRLAIHLDEKGKIKSHQLIPITATVQDENAIYVPAFGNEAKAKRAIEDALLHGKYTKG